VKIYTPLFKKLYFISKVHKYLLRAGIPTASFSGHSLRKGAAVLAKGKGLSKDEIKSLGRGKSNAVDLYINDVSQPTLASNLTALNSRLLSVSGPPSPSSCSRLLSLPRRLSHLCVILLLQHYSHHAHCSHYRFIALHRD